MNLVTSPHNSRLLACVKSAYRVVALPAALLLVVVCALYTSPGVDAQSQVSGNLNDERARPNTNVRGRVVYDDSGQVVRRARILLVPHETGEHEETRAGTTNGRGEFQIEDVMPGSYFVAVEAVGLLSPFAIEGVDETGTSRRQRAAMLAGSFQEIQVASGGTTDVVVRARRGGVMTGRVMYADGAPATNVQLLLWRKEKERLTRIITGLNVAGFAAQRTNDQGAYRVAGLPSGEYVLAVAERDTNPGASGEREYGGMSFASDALAMIYYGGEEAERRVIAINAGSETAGIDITIPDRRTFAVEGVAIARRDRQPLKGATVYLRNRDVVNTETMYDGSASPGAHFVMTDGAGHWSFPEAPEGDYVLKVVPQVEYPSSGMAMNGNMNIANMNRGGMNANGNVVPANVAVMTNSNGNMNISIDYNPRRRYVTQEREIKVVDSDVTGLTIEIPSSGRITGTVEFEGGRPANAYTTVTLTNEAGAPLGDEVAPSAQATVQGSRFMIDGLPDENFYINASSSGDRGSQFYLKAATARGRDLLREPLRVAEGGEVTGVRLVMARDWATFIGRVAASKPDDADEESQMQVVLVPAERTRWRQRLSFRRGTVIGGTTVINAPPGEYLIFTRGSGSDHLSEAEIQSGAATATRIALRPNERREVVIAAVP